MTVSIETILLSIAILLVLSAIASKLSDRFGVPALLIFLIIGILAGSEGLGGIYFDNAAVAQGVGLLALAIILFSGGLDTEWQNIRSVVKESITLATVGVLLTALILGIAAHWLLGITLLQGLLIGAITSSTDAAAVFSILRGKGVRLKKPLAPLLEFESGSNDPMAVFLTIGLIQLIQNPALPWYSLILLFLQQMVIGGIAGILFGKLMLYLINRVRLGYEGLYPVLTLGIVIFTFALTSLLKGSGFLAVYLAGLMLARVDFLHKRSLLRFYDGLAWLFQIVMFLTLGLLVFPSQLIPVIIPGLILSAILIFIARPVSVWISLLPFRYTTRQKNFISWVGLRGAVPIILATYPRLAGLDGNGLIFNIVFFVVISSVLIQGTGLARLARLLKVEDLTQEEPGFPLETSSLRGWRGILREVVVSEGSAVIGKAIYEVKLPKEYLVVLVARGDQFLIPNGSLVLQVNDRMLGLAKPEIQKIVSDMIESGHDGSE